MSGGLAGTMQQKAPVEDRAAQTNPLFGQMQGNLLSQFASRMMMPGGISPVQQLMIGQVAPQPNRYQQMLGQQMAGDQYGGIKPPVLEAGSPVNVRTMTSPIEQEQQAAALATQQGMPTLNELRSQGGYNGMSGLLRKQRQLQMAEDNPLAMKLRGLI